MVVFLCWAAAVAAFGAFELTQRANRKLIRDLRALYAEHDRTRDDLNREYFETIRQLVRGRSDPDEAMR